MYRQIKFRGKRADNSKWVYGDSIKHTDNPSKDFVEEITYIGGKVPNARKCGAMKWLIVVPSTLGQFTGLTDCNGKEIYEGDILEFPGDEYSCPETVIFKEGCFVVVDGHTEVAMNAIDTKSRTIIGNIHDNPELIPNQQRCEKREQ